MKNKEFYKDKIYEAACKYRRIAVNKETGELLMTGIRKGINDK